MDDNEILVSPPQLPGASDGWDDVLSADGAPVEKPDEQADDSQDRISVLEDTLSELREQMASAAAGRGSSDPREIAAATAQALIEANAQQRALWHQEQQQRDSFKPPALTEEEEAQIITDPKLMHRKMLEAALYGAQVVEARLAPRIRMGEIMHGLGQPSVDLLANLSLQQARDIAESTGIDASRFEELAPEAYRIMSHAASQQQDPAMHYTRLTLSPQAVAAAVQMAQTRVAGGPPVQRTAPPPSIGTGSSEAPTPKGGAARRPALVGQMKKHFGIKSDFSEEELARAAEKGKYFDAYL